MPETSSADRSSAESGKGTQPVFEISFGRRLGMVLLGYIPFLHFASVLACLVLPLLGHAPRGWAWCAIGVLYLAPPLVCRATSLLLPMPDGRFDIDSRELLLWWFYAQWQVIFNRFPALEELLRMVPGLYSTWLRLWGSKVGGLVYWAPGLVLLDRSCLRIGGRVVFGLGVTLSPHLLAPDAEGRRLELLISPIILGGDSLIGGYSWLGPGSRVAAGEILPAYRKLRPFNTWAGGPPQKGLKTE